VFPATSNKREIVDKQKMDDTNISGRSHEVHLTFSSGNWADKVKIRTCQ